AANQIRVATCICSFVSHPFAIANVVAITLLFALLPLRAHLLSRRRPRATHSFSFSGGAKRRPDF
ncbi:MAG: hypothetical protein LBE57_00450, partial [Methanosarcinales archaeon]|nr:hypothetical protein [Methanosarcinales archaeon]